MKKILFVLLVAGFAFDTHTKMMTWSEVKARASQAHKSLQQYVKENKELLIKGGLAAATVAAVAVGGVAAYKKFKDRDEISPDTGETPEAREARIANEMMAAIANAPTPEAQRRLRDAWEQQLAKEKKQEQSVARSVGARVLTALAIAAAQAVVVKMIAQKKMRDQKRRELAQEIAQAHFIEGGQEPQVIMQGALIVGYGSDVFSIEDGVQIKSVSELRDAIEQRVGYLGDQVRFYVMTDDELYEIGVDIDFAEVYSQLLAGNDVQILVVDEE